MYIYRLILLDLVDLQPHFLVRKLLVESENVLRCINISRSWTFDENANAAASERLKRSC